MISSVPRPYVPPVQSALYQMCCDLSELAAAGWRLEIAPALNADLSPASMTVRFTRPFDPPALPPRSASDDDSPRRVFGYTLNRFSLPSDLPRVIRDFHKRVFPIPPEGTLPTKIV